MNARSSTEDTYTFFTALDNDYPDRKLWLLAVPLTLGDDHALHPSRDRERYC
jgi:hypothetical protein